MKKNSSVFIHDVADHAGVSIATVSRVMNEKPHISEDVRQRVLEAIEEVVYQRKHVLFLCNSNQDPEREAHFISLLEAENVAGVYDPTLQDRLVRYQAAGVDRIGDHRP